jgi:hypothetical protein
VCPILALRALADVSSANQHKQINSAEYSRPIVAVQAGTIAKVVPFMVIGEEERSQHRLLRTVSYNKSATLRFFAPPSLKRLRGASSAAR